MLQFRINKGVAHRIKYPTMKNVWQEKKSFEASKKDRVNLHNSVSRKKRNSELKTTKFQCNMSTILMLLSMSQNA